MKYINIENLSFTYPLDTKKSLNNINFSIDKGSINLIVGKSGSGKSTLGRAIVGTVPYFYGGTISGKIEVEGKLLSNMSHRERAQRITMVFQDPEKQLMMNKVHREVAFGLENVGVDEKVIKKRVYEALQFVRILHLADRDVTSLSGGEKQKVALASALSYMPECIILDEPTSQLDPASSEEIINLVNKINDELGITIIVIEQRINKWFDIADCIGVMNNGNIKVYKDKRYFYDNCSCNEFMFMPDYLKFFKKMGFKDMPYNFKDARKKLMNTPITIMKNVNSLKEDTENVNNSYDKNETILKIKNLRCGYDSKEILHKVNMTVNKGEFISIMGANGAGKSTLLKTIMGLNSYKGSIKLYDKEVKNLDIREIAKYVGYVSQNPNDYLSKDSVYDELKFTMDNYNIYDQNVIEETLKKLEIYDVKDKNPRDLSGGQRQRVAIASILVLKPKIILLDEPTRGLESDLKAKLGNILTKLNKEGTSIILVTHDADFSSSFCKRFTIMFNGIIVADGGKSEVLGNGIYYTTSINKLLRSKDKNIFTLKDAVEMCRL